MIDDAGFDCPIVGFEFIGDPLLEGEFLPLRQGLTILYGLNGAGKTRLIRGIRAALTGVSDDVGLGMIVRMPQDVPDDRRTYSSAPRPLEVALAHAISAAGILDVDGDPYWLATHATEVIDEYIETMAGDTDPDFTREVVESRYFLLVPTGTAEHPFWDAWAVADRSMPASSRVQSELDALYAEFDKVPGDDDAWSDAQEEMLAAARPRALYLPEDVGISVRRLSKRYRPVHFSPYCAGETESFDWVPSLEVSGRADLGIDLGIDLIDLDGDPSSAARSYLASMIATLLDKNRFRGDDKPLAELDDLQHLKPFEGDRSIAGISHISDDFATVIERTITQVSHELSQLANEFLGGILPDAPVASLRIVSPALRVASDAVVWRFSHVGLDDLSTAERLWATRSINLAIHRHRRRLLGIGSRRPAVWLIDEPEAALHRTAESEMAEALVEHARSAEAVIVAATHSPALLDAPTSHLIEVQRGGGRRRMRSLVHALDLSDRDSLSQLGLTPSDLLRLPRAILLVEGPHDETVVRAFLGARLRRARVEIITLHGSKNLRRTLESEVLYKFTSAKVVALLDNIRLSEVTPVWQEAVRLAKTEGAQRGADYIFRTLPKAGETGALRSWLATALAKGYHDRVEPFGLQRRDVLEYLPAGAFTSRRESWDELRELRASENGTPLDEGGLKEWIAQRFDVDFSGSAVETAVAAEAPRIDTPPEFLALMAVLEDTSWRTKAGSGS